MTGTDWAAIITASGGAFASIVAAFAALSARSQVQTPGTKTIGELVEETHAATAETPEIKP